MRIGIDARWIFTELSGIGTYTQELIRHLAREDRENEYFLFFHHRSLMARTAELTQYNTAPNFNATFIPYGPLTLRNQLRLPGYLHDHRIDVFHSTNFMIPFRAFPRRRPGPVRCIVTIHDLIPLLFPEYTPRAKKKRFYPLFVKVMHEVGKRADIIITVSESSRRDIIKHLRIPPERETRVVVTAEGVDTRYQPGATRIGAPKTILYVGRFDPYKNVVRLVEAFARLREEILPDAQLRLIGPEDPRYPEPRERARALGVEPYIAWSGYVSEEGLKQAYQEADVLVLPSRYEGFGLPVLEAMACGTPVICSNTSALPEVAGEAAVLVEPDDTEQLVDALSLVLTQPARARELREKGIAHAARFTWSKTAQATMQIYERAMALE